MQNNIIRLTEFVGLSLAITFIFMPQLVSALEVGEQAPDFRLQASDGNTYSLAQYRGKTPVVIAFFPKAFTFG